MPTELTDVEARVLGSLVEKSLTTPELYPLTLNALVNACNQKTSREPVMSLDYSEVEQGVNSLIEKGFAARRYEPGGRAAKFGHRIEVLLGSEDPKIIALVAVLLLRGPQTLGELKTRTERLCAFESAAEIDALLQQLAARADGGIVSRAARLPGQKEARYRQLFTTELPVGAPPVAEPPQPHPADRAAALEKRVEDLESRLAALEARLPPQAP
jgi:uncharacterized protein YceH (UPF0502 family)